MEGAVVSGRPRGGSPNQILTKQGSTSWNEFAKAFPNGIAAQVGSKDADVRFVLKVALLVQLRREH
jgi:hypothetical protein